MVAILIAIFNLVVLPVVVERTIEDRFHAIKPHLREIWWLIGFVYIGYWIFLDGSERYFMAAKQGFGVTHPIVSCFIVALAGAALFSAYWWFLGKALPVKADSEEPPQGEQKKPDVQQNSEGSNSPNIVGNHNTVNYGDPKTNARLDEITRLLKAQGDRFSKKSLLDKYPMGYVIFDVDSTDSVFPYKKELVDKWEFNWDVVQISEVKNDIAIRMPDITRKGASHPLVSGISIGGEKKVGPFARGVGIFSDGDIVLRAEILAIRNDGIVFLLGFQPDKK
jgi:hypothetical protein